MSLLIEFNENVNRVHHEEMAHAIREYLLELPKDVEYVSVSRYPATVHATPPLIEPHKVRLIGTAKKEILTEGHLVLHKHSGVFQVKRLTIPKKRWDARK